MLPVPGDNPQGGHDARPLPLIVADKWQFPLQHHDTDDGVMYAIQDWIAGLTSTNNRMASKLWAEMHDKLMLPYQSLKYMARDNKTYNRRYTYDTGLYLIAQHLRLTTKRPALRTIHTFLANAGAFADHIRRDPTAALDTITHFATATMTTVEAHIPYSAWPSTAPAAGEVAVVHPAIERALHARGLTTPLHWLQARWWTSSRTATAYTPMMRFRQDK